MKIHLEDLTPLESYNLMISAIVPRPIALVTTIDKEGRVNAAPFSYFQGLTSDPQLLMISVGRNKGVPKDTVQNIEETREFVVNVVTEDMIEQTVQTSVAHPRGVSELEIAGLTAQDSDRVKPPRILESPVNIECRLYQIIQVGNSLQFLILGEALCYHIRDDLLLQDNTIDPFKLKAVDRMGGSYYCRVRDVFEVARPQTKK